MNLFSFLLSLVLLVPSTSSALTIVDQPLDASLYGLTSMYGDQNMVQQFTLTHDANINEVTWAGLFSSGITATTQSIGNFELLLFANDPTASLTDPNGSGTITGLPYYQPFYMTSFNGIVGASTALPDPLHGGSIYQWTADFSQLHLSAGSYWIGIRSAANEKDFFLWSRSSSDGGPVVFKALANSFDIGKCDPLLNPACSTNPAGWIWSPSDQMAFSLNHVPVPEPSSIMFLLVGLGSFCACRWLFWRSRSTITVSR